MAKANFSLKDLLEAGVHFGHNSRRWNPKMAPFIYGEKDKVHIIDLDKTAALLNRSLKILENIVAEGGKVLFVGTKKQAQDPIKEAAEKTGQFYINYRWLGGTLTNWKTISKSISRMKRLEKTLKQVETDNRGYTKKEILNMHRQYEKLYNALGGIADMNGRPDIIFIIDITKENIAVEEGNKLEIPIVAICDTNSDPEQVDFPIPGNDDAIKSINLYLDLATKAILSGLKAQLAKAGKDVGEMAEVVEPVIADEEEKKAEAKEDQKEAKEAKKATTKKEAQKEEAKKEAKEAKTKEVKEKGSKDKKEEKAKKEEKKTASKSNTKKSTPKKTSSSKKSTAKKTTTKKASTTKAKKGGKKTK
jgi:small subunit ribosomal protein S2